MVLGIVQGLSEFLPISSTAHIVLAQKLMGLEFPGLSLEIFLHLASALALILYFRRELLEISLGFIRYPFQKRLSDRKNFWLAIYLTVVTAITGLLGVSLKEVLDAHLKTPLVLGLAFVTTAFFLVFVERIHRHGEKTMDDIRLREALWISLAQSIAVIPGVSRAGATLVGGLLVGLKKEDAVRFSFLLALPVILGSSVLAFKDWNMSLGADISIEALAIGFVMSFVFSLVGIKWLIAFVQKSRLIYFAGYCFLLGLFCLTFGRDFLVIS